VSQTLVALIDYYPKCFEKQRRDELRRLGGASLDGILFCRARGKKEESSDIRRI